jgi:DNA-binding HxlR family transcriptional regulator
VIRTPLFTTDPRTGAVIPLTGNERPGRNGEHGAPYWDDDPPPKLNLKSRPWKPGQRLKMTPFGQLPRQLYWSKAFTQLSDSAQLLLIYHVMQYDGYNNGKLVATLKKLKGRGWGSSPNRLHKALKELIAAKLIVRTHESKQHESARYELTWLPKKQPYKKDRPQRERY